MVAPTGIEPVLSALKGPRVNQLHHGANTQQLVVSNFRNRNLNRTLHPKRCFHHFRLIADITQNPRLVGRLAPPSCCFLSCSCDFFASFLSCFCCQSGSSRVLAISHQSQPVASCEKMHRRGLPRLRPPLRNRPQHESGCRYS